MMLSLIKSIIEINNRALWGAFDAIRDFDIKSLHHNSIFLKILVAHVIKARVFAFEILHHLRFLRRTLLIVLLTFVCRMISNQKCLHESNI